MKHENVPPITSRIFLILEQKKISQSELARRLNIRQSTLCGWKQRNNEPEAELLEPISKALDVSLQWLITGEDKELPELPADQKKLLAYYEQCCAEGKERILEQAEFILSKYPKKGELLKSKIS